jgi:biopolymer transport protein ExbD
MTDVIFLLLIFFMLTASFITPSGLPVNLPTSKSSEIIMQKISVTITKDLGYYVNNQRTSRSNVEATLKQALGGNDGIVVLHCDASVPVSRLVEIAGIATSLKAKVSIAAKPQ